MNVTCGDAPYVCGGADAEAEARTEGPSKPAPLFAPRTLKKSAMRPGLDIEYSSTIIVNVLLEYYLSTT